MGHAAVTYDPILLGWLDATIYGSEPRTGASGGRESIKLHQLSSLASKSRSLETIFTWRFFNKMIPMNISCSSGF